MTLFAVDGCGFMLVPHNHGVFPFYDLHHIGVADDHHAQETWFTGPLRYNRIIPRCMIGLLDLWGAIFPVGSF